MVRGTTRALAGVLIAIVAWWATYVATQAYLLEGFSLGDPEQSTLLMARVAIGFVALTSMALLLRWRSAAVAAVITALVAFGLGAYAHFARDVSFLVGAGPSAAPGQGLWSGDPLRGMLNDLGNSIVVSIFHTTLLLLSATWLAAAIAGRGPGDRSTALVSGWRDLWKPIAGAAMVAAVAWLQVVANESMLAMLAHGHPSPLPAIIVVLIGLLSTFSLLRSPRAALGAGAMIALLLVISVATASGGLHGVSSPRAWDFSIERIIPALRGTARNTDMLVLFGAWTAILVGRTWASLHRVTPTAQGLVEPMSAVASSNQ